MWWAMARRSRIEALTGFFTALNYSDGMGALYGDLLAGWARVSDQPFNAFVDVYRPNKWGSWGALRHLGDDNPRWRGAGKGLRRVLSLIIPASNEEAWIGACLAAVAASDPVPGGLRGDRGGQWLPRSHGRGGARVCGAAAGLQVLDEPVGSKPGR